MRRLLKRQKSERDGLIEGSDVDIKVGSFFEDIDNRKERTHRSLERPKSSYNLSKGNLTIKECLTSRVLIPDKLV